MKNVIIFFCLAIGLVCHADDALIVTTGTARKGDMRNSALVVTNVTVTIPSTSYLAKGNVVETNDLNLAAVAKIGTNETGKVQYDGKDIQMAEEASKKFLPKFTDSDLPAELSEGATLREILVEYNKLRQYLITHKSGTAD